jgi:DNA polymerase-3 subunit epsilon
MKTVTFYDTETTGLPEWKIPSGDPKQPHIVQLGAVQCNAETGEIIQSIDLIIKPNGWEISEEMIAIHGISQKKALQVGVHEALAVGALLQMCGDGMRVAHNRTFDQRIIRIALKRFFTEEDQEHWAKKDNHDCSMLMSKPICKLPPYGRYGWKNPKLEEAYEFFTGKKLENAHSAMADCLACMEIYFAIKNNPPSKWEKHPESETADDLDSAIGNKTGESEKDRIELDEKPVRKQIIKGDHLENSSQAKANKEIAGDLLKKQSETEEETDQDSGFTSADMPY